MSVLPNNTFASPGVPFYAAAGGGAASTLQSPVAILPDVTGNTEVIAQATLNGNASLQALANGAGTGDAAVLVGATGIVYSMSVSHTNSDLAIGLNAAPQPAFLFDSANDTITLGTGGPGTVRTLNAFAAFDKSIDPTEANGVYVAPTSATSGTIANTVVSGGSLAFGSSATAAPEVLVISDAGAGSGNVKIGGNSGPDIYMIGSNGAFILPNIRTTATTNGELTLGPTATNALTMFIRDGAVADSAYIDITAGSGAGNAMRITGGVNASLSSNGAGSTLLLTSSVLGANPLANSAIKLSATPQAGALRNTGLQLSDPPSSLLSTEGGSWSSYGILNAQAGGYTSPQTLDFHNLPDGAYFVGSGVTAGQTPSVTDVVVLFTFFLYIRNGAITAGGYSVGPTNTYVVYPANGAAVAAGTLQLNWFGGAATSANWNVSAYPINGPIQGMG
jgi:hypothetical protein